MPIKSVQVTVTAAGTAVQASTDSAVRRYLLRSHQGNTGNLYVGGSDVSSANGLVLAKADPPMEVELALSELYVDAAESGDKLCIFQVL